MSGERDRTDPGVGSARGPSREPTVLGVGTSQAPAAPAPVVVLAPARERTVLGVAPARGPLAVQAPGREPSVREPPPEGWDLPAPASDAPPPVVAPSRDPSIAVDLSGLDHAPAEPETCRPGFDHAPAEPETCRPGFDEPSLVPAGVPRRRSRAWLLLLAGVTAAATVGYVRREQLRPLVAQVRPLLARVVAAVGPRHPADTPR